ncbi:tetratricopeptide repeat protein [Myroides marinus]|uniref:tetratricopeptide repeat protein n=1 Tax=Myroides marinus TaxID=703342 RepID=UPI0025786608|nr:hypothetical protein [Myroides marinus]MDM1380722.1 sel1 repeat family protein [Myroides marinus]MDM1387964.1 sel1 repeat family protein [Myroides marinus]
MILHRLHFESEGVDDIVKIMQYREYYTLIKRAAYVGHAEAQCALADYYDDLNCFGVNPNYNKEKTKYWYTKACEGGDGTACNNLAIMEIEDGEIELAKKLYERAIALGSEIAKENYKNFLKRIEESKEA